MIKCGNGKTTSSRKASADTEDFTECFPGIRLQISDFLAWATKIFSNREGDSSSGLAISLRY
jgi:hypothetical protein